MPANESDSYLHFSILQIVPGGLSNSVNQKTQEISRVRGKEMFRLAGKSVYAKSVAGEFGSAGLAVIIPLLCIGLYALSDVRLTYQVAELSVLTYLLLKGFSAIMTNTSFNRTVDSCFPEN